MTTVTIPSAREIVDRLAKLRRDLVEARENLRVEEFDLAGRKTAITAMLIASRGDAGIGKTESDKNRAIDEELMKDGGYQNLLANVASLKLDVTGLSVEVQIFEDYFSLARLEARVGLAEALRSNRDISD